MKSALITGANKGIGLETTKQLLKKGLFVYLGSRDIEKGNLTRFYRQRTLLKKNKDV